MQVDCDLTGVCCVYRTAQSGLWEEAVPIERCPGNPSLYIVALASGEQVQVDFDLVEFALAMEGEARPIFLLRDSGEGTGISFEEGMWGGPPRHDDLQALREWNITDFPF